MATQQQFPLDPNEALASGVMRSGRRTGHKDESLPPQSATMRAEQVRSYAHMEARAWQLSHAKERTFLMEVKWKEAKNSIEARSRSLRESTAAGRALNNEAKSLTENIGLLRE